jgi:effector-binding domain-containing protein
MLVFCLAPSRVRCLGSGGGECMSFAFRLLCLLAALLLWQPVASAQGGNPAPATDDVFGAEVTLPDRTIVFMSGSGKWDSAFETIVDAFKNVYALLEREGVASSGNPLVIYDSADDTGFEFKAAVPITDTLKNPPRGDIAVGKAPTGKAFKFIHRGSYDAMDSIYEAITNFLDRKGLDAKDTFIEEYVTDPRTTPEDKLVINVFVPTK